MGEESEGERKKSLVPVIYYCSNKHPTLGVLKQKIFYMLISNLSWAQLDGSSGLASSYLGICSGCGSVGDLNQLGHLDD